jgi:hypothetical protein
MLLSKFYVVEVEWTSKSDREIVSVFLVKTFNAKDAITQVLFGRVFDGDTILARSTEISDFVSTGYGVVRQVGNTVLNG